ncbi:MAG: hypothetical protein JHC81_04975 [Brevundimonas sp.]|uniref:hypothetical protein n=1 Tax=Brevundimonas sp. TaxID=1871086 RepID=UPI001A34A0F7|nr:hypothetical protein [Brevundimonas sp.]MBJ7446868.1 hypothetical protein [Brevundimonas sp.]
MSRLLSAVAGWKGYALVLAIGIALGTGGTWKVRDWMAAEAALKVAKSDLRAARIVVDRTQGAAQITQDVSATVDQRQAQTRTVYRTITERIPVYVPPEIDRAYPVPYGFVRLHDAAAVGAAPALPDGTGQPDDAPSGVALSAVAGTVIDNYGQCYAWRDQLIGWQDWYRQQQAAWEAPMR